MFLENISQNFLKIIGHYFLENSRNIHSNWIKAGPQATIGKANQNLIQFWCKAEQTGPAKVSLKLWKKWVPERNWDSIMNIWPSWCVWIPKWNFQNLHDFLMWLRCRNMCTQTPCRLWQVEYCLHSRLFPILRFSQPNPILILVPVYSQTTPILSFFPDYSQSQMTPNLTSLPLFSN